MNRAVKWAFILLACSACSEVTIQQGLDERAANEIVAELSERGLEASARPEGGRKQTWAIQVSSGARTDAVRELVRLGLPRQKQSSSAELLRPGLVPSPAEERHLHSLALQGDLAQTLEQLDGVLSARVHLSLPTVVKGAPSPLAQARGAVLLRVKGPIANWTERRRQDVRALVAGSVEGVGVEQVTLVLDEVAVASQTRQVAAPGIPLRRVLLSLLALLALAAVCWSCWGSVAGWVRSFRQRGTPGVASP